MAWRPRPIPRLIINDQWAQAHYVIYVIIKRGKIKIKILCTHKNDLVFNQSVKQGQ